MVLYRCFVTWVIASIAVPQPCAAANHEQSSAICTGHEKDAALSEGRSEAADDILDEVTSMQLLQHDVQTHRQMIATRFQFVGHPASICKGSRLDEVTTIENGTLPYGEYIFYSIGDNLVVGGKHLLHAFVGCMQDLKCGGFTKSSDGLVTLWRDSTNFSVSARDNLAGFHCYEKQSMDEITISPSNADEYDLVADVWDAVDTMTTEGMQAINAAYAASCKEDDIFQKQLDYIKKMQGLNDDFGQSWAAPVGFYQAKDTANVYVEAAYAQARLEECKRSYSSLVAEFENYSTMSCS